VRIAVRRKAPAINPHAADAVVGNFVPSAGAADAAPVGTKMKRRWKQVAVALVAVSAILVCLHRWLIDGIDGLIWGALFQEDTAYAAGYTDHGWRTARRGMTEEGVLDRIGVPLQVWTNQDGSVGMRWSRSPGDTHYRCRALEFSNGRVSEKYAEFYVD